VFLIHPNIAQALPVETSPYFFGLQDIAIARNINKCNLYGTTSAIAG